MPIQIQSPCLVPRVLHNDHTYVSYRHYEILNFAANFFHVSTPQIQPLLNKISSQTKYLAIDPRTPAFQYGGHRNKPTFNMLRYSIPSNKTLSTQQFSPTYTKGYTKDVLDEQRQHGTNLVIPPYFNFVNITDPWYQINLNCANESVKQRKTNENIMMFVLFDCTLLLHQTSITTVIKDLTSCNVDGYYLMAADLDTVNLSNTFVKGYQKLVSGLAQTNRPVIVAQAGKLGLALIGSGASGYAMGFSKLDTLAIDTFREQGGGPGQSTRYYFHNLLLPVYQRNSNDIANTSAITSLYPCSCSHCNGMMPSQIQSKNRTFHYIDFRLSELATLQKLTKQQRKPHLKELFLNAFSTCLSVHQELQQQPFKANRLPSKDFMHLDVIAGCL